jgi:predicted lipid-binding transport protein (Tim44 family)
MDCEDRMMNKWLVGALTVALVTTLMPSPSEAKRFGGGKSQGMQRSMPDRSTPQTPPAQPASPQPASPTPGVPATAGATAAAAAPAAAAAKRSWMGPLAGLAAGLGLVALFSALGLGEGLANFMMIALLALAAFFVIRFLLRRFGGTAQRDPLATASASAGAGQPSWTPDARHAEPLAEPVATPRLQSGSGEVSVTGAPLAPIGGGNVARPVSAVDDVAATAAMMPAKLELPEGFDLQAFERIAKMIFIRLQAANDAADLDDLRQFTTPEMFAASRLELQERGPSAQQTDVERVEAEVLDFSKDAGRQIVSVRFHGLVREEKDAPATAFDEIWHLVKPDDDSRPWAIAGIQQTQ